MPTRTVILAATPHCPKGDCGQPMFWSQEWDRWFCLRDGTEVRGGEAAQRAGYVGVWREAAA